VAFDFQQVEQLPVAQWDVPLYRVITNEGEVKISD
jgi:5-formyltetrahydrofolate cyclo-ligase